MNTAGIFSLEAALAGVDHDWDIFQTMAEIFAEQGPKDLADAAAALAAQDGQALARSAHRLKGALLQFSAPTVLTLAKELEELGAQGHLVAAVPVFARLEKELARLITSLGKTLEKGIQP
jgi:HPt (histidine-containing phosphotransfer) domain-containing protein